MAKKLKNKKVVKGPKAGAKKKLVKKASFTTKKKKAAKAPTAKKAPAKKVPLTKKAKEQETRSARLILKGKDRGFVTYDEILKEFPTIEDDILFLEDLYARLSASGVDVLEGGGALDMLNNEDLLKGTESKSDSYDSIQMYLKEIGQYSLIHANQEKELAKRIQQGDMEAKNLLARANLRLVVSIAKKYVGR